MARQRALICVALIALTLAAYWPLRFNDFINYDDQEYLTQNPHVQRGLTWEGLRWAFSTNRAANWHPLTWLSHMLDVELFGLNPVAHHFTNLGFHIVNALTLFLLLAHLTGTTWRSAFVAALFALHPLHVESVAWAAERKDVLSTFFGLLALVAYARYAQRPASAAPRFTFHVSRFTLHASPPYLLALAFFACSLLCKPMLVTLPCLMLLLDFWPLNRLQPSAPPSAEQDPRFNARASRILPLMLEKIPFFVLAGIVGVVTLLVQQGAMVYQRELSFSIRSANSAVACIRYLAKTVWPADLAVLYPHPTSLPAWSVSLAVLGLVVISALVLWNLRRRPYLAVGWLWFLGMLVPVLGFIQVGVQAMADRYTYLPSVGLFIMVAWLGYEWTRYAAALRPIAAAMATLMVTVSAAQTNSQVQVWRDTETLFTHAAAVTRGNWVAHSNLALLALRRYQDSQRSALDQQQLHPQPVPANRATSGVPRRDYLQEVVFHCGQALEFRPGFADPRVTLAKALTEQGRLDEARSQLEIALRLDPKNADAQQNLAEILLRQGLAAEAIAYYQAALRLKPDWEAVLNNLAWLLATHPAAEVRDGPQAVRLAERACALTHQTNLWFLHTLAAAYAENRDFPRAVTTARQACRLASDSGRSDWVKAAQTRLELYQSGQPYHQSTP